MGTIADLANQRICMNRPPRDHPLDDHVHLVIPEDTLESMEFPTSRSSESTPFIPAPTSCDPSLLSTGNSKPVLYTDMFVDNFLALSHQYFNIWQVRWILVHAINNVFCPLYDTNDIFRCPHMSTKKLRWLFLEQYQAHPWLDHQYSLHC